MRLRSPHKWAGVAVVPFALISFTGWSWLRWLLLALGTGIVVASFIDYPPPLRRIQKVARRWWGSGFPHPTREDQPRGDRYLDALRAHAHDERIEAETALFALLLAIQWGKDLCYWLERCTGDERLVGVLVRPLRYRSWVRVVGRAAYLLQQFDSRSVNSAVAAEFGDAIPTEIEPWLEAIQNRTVVELVNRRQLESDKKTEYADLFRQLASLPC